MQPSNGHANVDLHQVSHMDIADFTEDLVQISRSKLPPITPVINSIQDSTPSHIRSQDLENQIKDIDLALKKFDSHTPPIITKPTVTLSHDDHAGDKTGDIIEIQGDAEKGNSPHVLTHNASHDTHALRTWKRIASNQRRQLTTLFHTNETESLMSVPILSYLQKNSWFRRMIWKIYWWRLLRSPAKSHEHHCLELLWAWEPTDR